MWPNRLLQLEGCCVRNQSVLRLHRNLSNDDPTPRWGERESLYIGTIRYLIGVATNPDSHRIMFEHNTNKPIKGDLPCFAPCTYRCRALRLLLANTRLVYAKRPLARQGGGLTCVGPLLKRFPPLPSIYGYPNWCKP